MAAPDEKKCPRCHQTVGQYEYGEFLGNNKVRLYWKCASCYLEYDGSTHDITPDENPFAVREDIEIEEEISNRNTANATTTK